jgi:methionine synthase I (cobalamin-dependent)
MDSGGSKPDRECPGYSLVRQRATKHSQGSSLTRIETMSDLGKAQAAISGVRRATELPIICTLSYAATPEHMGEVAAQLREDGAQVIGGCCGTTPAHIQAMAAALKQQVVGRRYSAVTRWPEADRQ